MTDSALQSSADPESFELAAGDLTARINARGAELTSLRKRGVPYLYEGDGAGFWPKSAPLLFPVVGRCPEDRLTFEGRALPMPKHGFARELTWEPNRGSDDALELSLEDSKATRKSYPYSFELTALYQLHPDRLDCRYFLENLEDRAIPFSFGCHPAFRWPLDPAAPRESWKVVFPKPLRAERVLLEDGLRGANKEPVLKNKSELPLADALFAPDAIVLRNPGVREAVLASDASPRKVRLRFSEISWMGIWSQPGAPFVCLEPWRGVASKVGDSGDVETKEAIEWLDPGAVFEFELTIEPI
jgi:galactose mutarotase-like enzyme